MKSNILFTIIIVVILASNVLAQCPATENNPEEWALGPSVIPVTYASASPVSVTDETANLNNDPAPPTTITTFEDLTCTQTETPVAGQVGLTEDYYDDLDTYYPFRNVAYDESRDIMLSVKGNSDECAYGKYEIAFHTRTVKTVERADAQIWQVRGFAYNPDTGYLYLAGNTIAGDVLVASIDVDTNLLAASSVISHDTSNLATYGAAFVNGNLVIIGYLAAEPIIITLNPDTLEVIAGWTVDASTDEQTGANQYTYDPDTNTVIFVNTVSNVLNVEKAVIGPLGTITASGYSIPANDGITWTTINNVQTSTVNGDFVIAGSVNNGPGDAYASFAKFDNTNFDDSAAIRIDVKSTMKGDIPPRLGNLNIYAVGNTDTGAFVIKTNSAGVLQASGTASGYTFNDLTPVTMLGRDMIAIGGKYDSDMSTIFADADTLEQVYNFRQDLPVEVNALTTDGTRVFGTIMGSFGIIIYNIIPNPGVPEFSLTTMLLATLLAGGLVLFVVRRRK